MRNAKIRTEFWKLYEKTPGRHYARIDVVAATLCQKWFLSTMTIKKIAGPYPPEEPQEEETNDNQLNLF